MSNNDGHLSSHSMSPQPQDQMHSYCSAALRQDLSSAAPWRTTVCKLPIFTLEDNNCYVPLLPVCKEEEVSPEQQGPSLVQDEEPEPPHIKEEQEERNSSLVKDEEPERPQIKVEQEEELLQTPKEADGSTLTLHRLIKGSGYVLRVDADFPQLSAVSTEQQERIPSLVQEEPESPQIKEEQEEWNIILVQEEPEPPQIKEEQKEELLQTPEEAAGSTLTLLVVKSEDDENRETEPLASTSTEHMKTQAEEWATSQPSSDDQLLSSHGSESDTEDSDEWEETREDQSALNTLKSHKTQHVEGQRSSLSHTFPQDLKSSKLTPTTRSHTGQNSCICTECGKVFGHMSRLKQHMRIHTGEKPFTCKVCERRFNKKGDLKRHMMTHTGEKPFTCTDCQRSFSQNGHLKRHMITHAVEKAFTCTECGEVFVHMGSLKLHMRIHTGEKHFTCTDCGKVFGYMSKMKQHMMTHTGEKPFTCTCCSKAFGHMISLKLHMRIHTGEIPFTCKVCEIRFNTNGDLNRHMRIHTAVCLGSEVTRDISYRTNVL